MPLLVLPRQGQQVRRSARPDRRPARPDRTASRVRRESVLPGAAPFCSMQETADATQLAEIDSTTEMRPQICGSAAVRQPEPSRHGAALGFQDYGTVGDPMSGLGTS